MKNVKRLLLLLTALCFSMPAFAEDVFRDGADKNVSARKDQHSGFRVGVDALYLQPTNSDLFYATKLFPSPAVGTFPALNENFAVDPDYHWGVYAFIGYAFPCTSNDLTLAYTYLYGKDSSITPGPPDPLDPAFGVVTLPVSFALTSTVRGKTRISLNAVDLEGGQRFKADGYDMRMFAGLRYSSIDHTLNTVIIRPPANIGPVLLLIPPSDQEFNSQFNGLGPRVGAEGHYSLGGRFGLNANMSASLLIGHLNSYFSGSFDTNLPVENFYFESKSDAQTRVVPVLEGKLGLDYTYPLGDDCNKSALVVEAGYQTTNYFNIVDHARTTETNVPTTIIIISNAQNTTSDVGFDGIYAGIKYYA